MKRILNVTSLLSLIILSSFSPARSDGDGAVEKSAMDLNYSVDAFECDEKMRVIEKKREKIMGMSYRICLEPNPIAKGDGVGIKDIIYWEWQTDNDDGVANQTAVIDGKGVGGLSHVECLDGGMLCYLDTMLTSGFHRNPGSVRGNGEASFTAGTGSVPVKGNLFKFSFNVKFKDGPDGRELTGEETAELMRKVNEHNAAVEAERRKENTIVVEDSKSLDEMKEEL